MTSNEGKLTIILLALLSLTEELALELELICHDHEHTKQVLKIREMRYLFLGESSSTLDTGSGEEPE